MSDLTKAQEQKLKSKAKDLDNRIRKFGSELISRPWDIAFIAYEVKKGELFKYMPRTYPTIQEWRVDVGIKRSTFFRGIRLAENLLPHIPKKELRSIPLENADLLLKLPPDQRGDPKMWEKARKMNEDDFLEVVNAKRKQNGESPEDGRVTFKLRMSAGQADVIKSAIEMFIEQEHLEDDNQARALELIAAEWMSSSNNGKSFMAKLGERITASAFELSQLKSTAESMRAAFNSKDNKSGDEILLVVASKLDALETGILKSVEALAAATKNMASKQPKGQQSLSAPPLEAAKAAAAAGTSSKVN